MEFLSDGHRLDATLVDRKRKTPFRGTPTAPSPVFTGPPPACPAPSTTPPSPPWGLPPPKARPWSMTLAPRWRSLSSPAKTTMIDRLYSHLVVSDASSALMEA